MCYFDGCVLSCFVTVTSAVSPVLVSLMIGSLQNYFMIGQMGQYIGDEDKNLVA